MSKVTKCTCKNWCSHIFIGHVGATKPITITKLAFPFFMMNIEHKMKLKLTIVINGFGARIWIQLSEKGEI